MSRRFFVVRCSRPSRVLWCLCGRTFPVRQMFLEDVMAAMGESDATVGNMTRAFSKHTGGDLTLWDISPPFVCLSTRGAI
jgi:hypothetical protein